MSGPRLCSLRIPNGGGNVLIDNIESDSTPVIYTRRSRFLDEELDETKDIITTTSNGGSGGGVGGGGGGAITAEQTRSYHKISMLMTDGVMTTLPNDLNSDLHEFSNQIRDTVSSDIDIALSYDEQRNQGDECDANPNQKYCTNTTHMPPTPNSLNFERTFNGLTINDHDLSQNVAYDQQSVGIDDVTVDLKAAIDSIDTANDKQITNQFLHMHQFRPTHQISLADETSMLRRQQLSRVAEWVQNNNHEACLGSTDTNYSKTVTQLNNNSDEISNRSIDRNLKSMINCNNLTNSELEVGKYGFVFTYIHHMYKI